MSVLHGDDLRKAFVAATHCLERYRDAINALNVFPVPDGDTGTNMLLTMRSALEKCPESAGVSAGEVFSQLADGAFWGARGNSGVILSQLFRGFAEALQEQEVCDGPGLSRALTLASDAAYRSVAQPVEGTMLSVIQAASIASAENSALEGDVDALSLWENAFRSAADSLYLTPAQMPLLKEAGVVDAGGMGVVVIMGGALCSLSGRDQNLVDQAVAECCVEPASPAATGTRIDSHFLDSTLETGWGYCIQFLIEGDGLDCARVREEIDKAIAKSAVVVGDRRILRVHVHAPDPGPVLSYGAALGELNQIEIDNMRQQNLEFVAGHRAKQNRLAQVGVVAVAQGEGLAQLLREAGCAEIIEGGHTMNPTVGQFLDAAAATGAADVIVLPNNANVVAAAQQSAGANQSLHVVPSKTVPQGVAAMLAFNQEEPLEHNLRAMTGVLSGVVTIEVTQAVRSTNVGGSAVDAGRYIGLLEGGLAASEETPEAALKTVLDGVVHSSDQIVTLYQGIEATPGAAEELRRRMEAEIPGIQVDLVYGGQPHYHYLASVE